MKGSFHAASAVLVLYFSIANVVVAASDGISDQAGDAKSVDSENMFSNSHIQPRVVGGHNANEGRYPYIVSLLTPGGLHKCGGTLVAPDVVLTAAHCQASTSTAHVGRWNRGDANDDFEEFEIQQPEYPHPSYDEEESAAYDFMLLKLDQRSTKPYVSLNHDVSLPLGSPDELTVLGFGNTVSGVASESLILQEVDVSSVRNDVCEASKDAKLDLSYQGLITDEMICASDRGEDSCQGDSGGPLVVGRGSASRDVLVGVTSWGFGCALPAFPGVYSRISSAVDWIEETICRISSKPPDELNCDNTDPIDPARSVPITVVIQFDDFPSETSWSIVGQNDRAAMVDVPPGTYTKAQSRVQETIFLPGGGNFVFQINDNFGDGLCCNSPGNYVVSVGHEPNGEVLVSGGGQFGFSQTHDFRVPTDYERPPDVQPVIGPGEIPLTVAIQLDHNPHEVGWKVERLGIEVETVIAVPAGIYQQPNAQILRTVVLEEGELYYLKVYDLGGNGIDNGSVRAFLGTTDTEDDSRLIFESDGNFKTGTDVSFVAKMNLEPTPAPQYEGDKFLTLLLFMDTYPGEVGVQLRARNEVSAVSETSRQFKREDTVVFFRPPRFYSDYANQVVTERIPIPTSPVGTTREYTLIVTDSFADGLCCNWNRTAEAGYILYEGEQDEGIVLVESKFKETAREVKIFAIDGEGRDIEDPDGGQDPSDIEMVEIRVTITLDIFPDETGFYIENIDGDRVVDVPPGTYRDKYKVVEERFELEVGVYWFTILDVFGDGLNRDDGFYMVELVSDSDRPALIHQRGTFVTENTHAFVLEGESADYPLTVKFMTDRKPQEFGFVVKRIDVLEEDALVATVPQGSYLSSFEDVMESVPVKHGGLYRVIFDDAGKDGIGGEIRVIAGSVDEASINAEVYVVDATSVNLAEVRVFAGNEAELTTGSGQFVDLRILFDQFPHEIEWVLVGGIEGSSAGGSTALQEQAVVAFGPSEPYSQSLAGKSHTETIYIPEHSGRRTFSIIVTDATGDGVCCSFGEGGPVELFLGAEDEGELLFSHPFKNTGRFASSFVVAGSGAESLAMTFSFAINLCAFVWFFMAQ